MEFPCVDQNEVPLRQLIKLIRDPDTPSAGHHIAELQMLVLVIRLLVLFAYTLPCKKECGIKILL